MDIYSFLTTSLIIILTPGTGVIYTISMGVSRGRKESLFAVLGCTLGIVPHLCAGIILSLLVMNMNHQIFYIIKIFGAIYLLYLGLGMLFFKNRIEFSNSKEESRPWTIIRDAILINLLNPKLTLFFISFLPQYVNLESQNYIMECILYGTVFMILSTIIFIGYGLLAGTAKVIMNSPGIAAIAQKLFGVIFIVFAIQLSISSI